MAGVPLAWLLLLKLRGRFIAAVAGIAFAVILALVQLGFQNALYASITRLYASFNADLVLISPQYQNIVARETFPERRLYQTLGAASVESVEPVYIDQVEWTNPENRYERFILLVGIRPHTGVVEFPDVNRQIAAIKEPGTVLFDENSHSEFGPIGKLFNEHGPVTTEISRRSIEVGGLFRMGASFANSGHVLTSDVNFLQMVPIRKPGDIDVGLIRLKPGGDAEAARQSLASLLPEDVTVLTKRGFLDRESRYWSESLPIGFLFRASLILSLVVGAVVVYQILYSGVSEHLAEYATLKAIGYTHAKLFGVVLEEAVILSVLGFLPGLLLAAGVYHIVEAMTFLPLKLTVLRIVSAYALTALMCVVAGLFAMRRLYTADPAEVF